MACPGRAPVSALSRSPRPLGSCPPRPGSWPTRSTARLSHSPQRVQVRSGRQSLGWRWSATVSHGRTQWVRAGNLLHLAEQAKHCVGRARRAGGQDPAIALPPQPLADVLKRRPLRPSRMRRRQPEARERVLRREIRDAVDFNLPAPEVTRHLPVRRDRKLCQRSVPLRPHRFLVVGEVHPTDGVAALPSPIAGWVRSEQRITAVRQLTPPHAVDVDRADAQVT
jgi:hypothetical protein